MKSLLAEILFKIGDKLSRYDSMIAAYWYVRCMAWSDQLKPWHKIEE